MNSMERNNEYWERDDIQSIEIHYFTPTAFEKSNAIWPIRLGRNEAKPNYRIGPRSTPYYSLHFVLDGNGYFEQNDQIYELKRGDLFCLFPKLSHEYYTSLESPLKLAWIAFDGKMALEVLGRIGLRPGGPHIGKAFDTELESRLEPFFQLVRSSGKAGNDLMKSSVFWSIIGWLIETAERPHDKESDTRSWLEKGLAYMDIHFAEGITIKEISKYAGVDRTHFGKAFRKAYGITPIQYLQQLKMKAAKTMLQETDHKLAEIAHSVGYPDLFTFSKAFKKVVGMPPNHYRHKVEMSRTQV